MNTIQETIPAGKNLREAIAGFYASRYLPAEARIDLSGAVRDVVIAPAPGAPSLRFSNSAFLVQGHARQEGDEIVMFGTVSWLDNGIPRVLAGQLHDAGSEGVSVHCVTDRRQATASPPSVAPAAKEAVAAEPASVTPASVAPPPKPAPAAPASWDTAVAASKTNETPAPAAMSSPTKSGIIGLDGLPRFRRGDIVVHPRYGRCSVVRVPKFHKLKLRRTTGAFFDLHLKVCKFEIEEDDDGRSVYRVQIVGRNDSQ